MWLVIPTTSFQSVQDMEGLTLLSDLQLQMLERSVTSRGKPKPQQGWQLAWKTAAYMKRLSGLTYPPSTVNRSVDLWIASLAATRANPIALPVHSVEPKMTASLSMSLFASSKKCGLRVYSEKTSLGTRTDSLKPLSLHWKNWAIALRQEFSAREKWGLPTEENGFSSWPTCTARDWKGQSGRSLKGQETYLPTATKMWLTPRATDTGQGEKQETFQKRMGDRTESAFHSLPSQVTMWQTPKASRGGWEKQKDVKSRMDRLDYAAEQGFQSSLLVQMTEGGQKYLMDKPRLNPLFTEWLQGWPLFWTEH